jgi:hypothetical protein
MRRKDTKIDRGLAFGQEVVTALPAPIEEARAGEEDWGLPWLPGKYAINSSGFRRQQGPGVTRGATPTHLAKTPGSCAFHHNDSSPRRELGDIVTTKGGFHEKV